MATSTIPNPNKIITKTLSLNSSAASGSGTVTVCGRIATLTAKIHNNVTGTSLTLAAFDASYAPITDTWLSVCAYASDGLIAEANVKTDGKIVFAIPSGYAKDMKISGAWVTKG